MKINDITRASSTNHPQPKEGGGSWFVITRLFACVRVILRVKTDHSQAVRFRVFKA